MRNKVLTIEQMQELVDMGIDVSKASMCWIKCSKEITVHPYDKAFRTCYEKHLDSLPRVIIPAFTLKNVLCMLPDNIMIDNKSGSLLINWTVCYEHYDDSDYSNILHSTLHSETAVTILTAAFNMLKWCKQNNYI